MGIRSQGDPAQSYNDVFSDSGLGAYLPAPPGVPTPGGHTATGGIISDYTSPPGTKYRCHTFNSSGEFVVTELSGVYPAHMEYLVVGGGGGCGVGRNRGGGGGAGGLRTNVPGVQNAAGSPLTAPTYPIGVKTYPITVGAGGGFAGSSNDGSDAMNAANGDGKGSNSLLTDPGPSPAGGITCQGGGGGGAGLPTSTASAAGGAGGSGGGGAGPDGDPGFDGPSSGGNGNSPNGNGTSGPSGAGTAVRSRKRSGPGCSRQTTRTSPSLHTIRADGWPPASDPC